MTVVLVSPPMAKAAELLLDIATLEGFLEAKGVPCVCVDANVEAQEWLLQVDRVHEAVGRLTDRSSLSAPVSRLLRAWRLGTMRHLKQVRARPLGGGRTT